MTQYTSPPLLPPLPDGPAVAPDRVVPLLIGATVGEIERELVLQTLARCEGNRTRAARMLGVLSAHYATRSGSILQKGWTCLRITSGATATRRDVECQGMTAMRFTV